MTAKERLLKEMEIPDWHRNKIPVNRAYSYKHKLLNDKLSLDIILEILDLLEIKPKQKEIW